MWEWNPSGVRDYLFAFFGVESQDRYLEYTIFESQHVIECTISYVNFSENLYMQTCFLKVDKTKILMTNGS